MTRTKWALALQLALLGSCASTVANAAEPKKMGRAVEKGKPSADACRVFMLRRSHPTVSVKKVGALVTHGSTPKALATVHNDKALVVAMTVGDLDTSLGPELCERIGEGPFLLRVWTEKGNLVGELSVPTTAPDRKHDAQVVCNAQRLGQKLFPEMPVAQHLALGLQESMGSLTTPEYRALVGQAMFGHDVMEFIKVLDKDIRSVGEVEWERCTLLVKK